MNEYLTGAGSITCGFMCKVRLCALCNQSDKVALHTKASLSAVIINSPYMVRV